MIWFQEQHIPCVCVTNRHLAGERSFLEQILRIAGERPKAIVLREKDLSEEEYEKLARQVLEIGRQEQVPVILHHFVKTAKVLQAERLHLPLQELIALSEEDRQQFTCLGTSIHSLDELKSAMQAGASYVFAGHIFPTDCKKDLAPRGLDFLEEICEQSNIPVYALGGIHEKNARACVSRGAAGIAIMSGAMSW